MKYVDRYPIIVSEQFAACRDFWARHLGFAVVFENDWFVYMQADGASIAFMSPDHPSYPPGPEAYVAGARWPMPARLWRRWWPRGRNRTIR